MKCPDGNAELINGDINGDGFVAGLDTNLVGYNFGTLMHPLLMATLDVTTDANGDAALSSFLTSLTDEARQLYVAFATKQDGTDVGYR